MDAEHQKKFDAIKARLKKEYRKVWDQEYDREEAERHKVPKGKTNKSAQGRRVQTRKSSKGTQGKRKTILILPAKEP